MHVTYSDKVARPTQTVKVCDVAICHVEHGNNQMPDAFNTVYATTHGQQSHKKVVMHTLCTRCNAVQQEARCIYLTDCAVWPTHHVEPQSHGARSPHLQSSPACTASTRSC